jgi:hypothetical protein
MPGRDRAQPSPRVSYPQPARVVVVGDLNGDDDALAVMLCAVGVTDRRGHWIAEDTHLVQLGDIVNRGPACRAAIDRLMRLEVEAEARDCRVTTLLGNHEAMVTLGNFAWCHPEEFLEFSSPDERLRFELARSDKIYELLGEATSDTGTTPISGQLRAWEEANAPGRGAYAEAFGPDGFYGHWVRRLPIAARVGRLLFVHGGLSPALAEVGLEDLQAELDALWDDKPVGERELPADCLLIADDGPLWNRRFVLDEGPVVAEELSGTLRHLSASTMIVGHTRTDQIPGGVRGEPAVRFGGRLICADVGIGASGGAPAALVIEGDEVYCWRAEAPRRQIATLPQPPHVEVTKVG